MRRLAGTESGEIVKRLIAGTAATAIVYVPLALYLDSAVGPTTPTVVLVAGITATALAATMLISTRYWSLRAVGLFLFLAGVATLLNGGYINYRYPLGDRTGEVINDAILAMWIVGSPLALTGVILYLLGGDRSDADSD